MTTPDTCPACGTKVEVRRLFGSGVPVSTATGRRKRRNQVTCLGCHASGPVAETQQDAWDGWARVTGEARRAS